MLFIACIPFYTEFETAKEGIKELMPYKILGNSIHNSVFSIDGDEVMFRIRRGTPTHYMRNVLIRNGEGYDIHPEIDKNIDAFIFQDSDIVGGLEAIRRVIYHFKSGKRIVHLPYCPHNDKSIYWAAKSREPFGRVGYHYPVSTTGLEKVDLIPMGFTLIDAEIFREYEHPWFRHYMLRYDDKQQESGEDYGFCILTQKEEKWVDFTMPMHHKDTVISDEVWEL